MGAPRMWAEASDQPLDILPRAMAPAGHGPMRQHRVEKRGFLDNAVSRMWEYQPAKVQWEQPAGVDIPSYGAWRIRALDVCSTIGKFLVNTMP